VKLDVDPLAGDDVRNFHREHVRTLLLEHAAFLPSCFAAVNSRRACSFSRIFAYTIWSPIVIDRRAPPRAWRPGTRKRAWIGSGPSLR
jgi:hypothetical protein